MTNVETSLLRGVPLFKGLPESEREQLASTLRRRRYSKGEVIFHRDDPGSSLFIIGEGSVKIGLVSPEGKELILSLLAEGDSFGELALLDGEPRSADATALEPSVLMSLQRDAFLRFLQTHPGSAAHLIAALSRHVRRLTDRVYDAAFLDLQTRLARAVLKLSAGEEDGEPFRLTQTQIGAMVGATRESVNKWLGFYERRGIIRRDGRSVTVLQPKKLQDYAQFDGDDTR
jgi:CRP-like cAMP-binding protein